MFLSKLSLLLLLFTFGRLESMQPPHPGEESEYSNSSTKSSVTQSTEYPTLYVVTRSTEKFKIFGRDNPTVGLFTTHDRGESWQHWGWHYTKCFSATIEPDSYGKVIYLACGNGIQKTTDSGKTWAITSGWEMTECLKVAIDPVNSLNVYAATAYGIFKSEDGGETWLEKNHGLASTFTPSVLLDPTDPAIIYAATEAGIYRSIDGADSWKLLGLQGMGIRTIMKSIHDHSTWLIGTENDGIFISTDSGNHWQPANKGLSHMTIYALAQDPSNADVLFAGTFRGGVYKSINGGTNWQSSNAGLTRLDIHALLVDPSDSNLVYCGTLGGGVFMSEDAGGRWKFIGLETSQVWDFTFMQSK